MRSSAFLFPAFLSIFLVGFVFSCRQPEEQAEQEPATVAKEAGEDLQLDKIPRVVLDGLKARFPEPRSTSGSARQRATSSSTTLNSNKMAGSSRRTSKRMARFTTGRKPLRWVTFRKS